MAADGRISTKIEKSLFDIVTTIGLAKVSGQEEDWVGDAYTAIIGFRSDTLNGSLVLCADYEFLVATVPFKPDLIKEQRIALDWLGELGNLIIGRFKNYLLDDGVEIELNPPSVSYTGIEILESYSDRQTTHKCWYEGAASDGSESKICLQLCYDSQAIEQNHSAPSMSSGMQLSDQGKVVYLRKPSKAQNAYFEQLAGIGWETEGKLEIDFASGARIKVACDHMATGASRSIRVGAGQLEISKQHEGVIIGYDTMTFFLPTA